MKISGCGACGSDHYGVELNRLPEKIKKDGLKYSHWFTCPVTHQRVLMRFKDRK